MTEKKAFPTPSTEDLEEIKLLKSRADQMGVKYHHRAGLKKMKEIVEAGMNAVTSPEVKIPEIIFSPEEEETNQPQERPFAKKARLRKEANELVRVRISCMNPNKKDWDGEIYTVSNSVVGTVKKYVPFNAENGWHVPKIIFTAMTERKCQIFHTVKDSRGNKVRKGKLIKELNIEVLPALTNIELKDLATQQAMANNLG